MNNISILVALAATSLATTSFAQETSLSTGPSHEASKNWNVGGGFQTLSVSNDDEDLDFGGLTFSAQYSFSNNYAIRASVHTLENDDFSDFTSDSFDLSLYYGTGLLDEGFKAYIGAGLFSDSWELGSFSGDESFSGFLLSGGVGYSWNYVAVDFIIGARAASDYADLIQEAGGSGTITAITTSLVLSARF
ncbi:MAG: hypothetical protein ACJAVV_002407 [Alphaproteobacteria bacterium]|jgi:hypothetical protein